MITIKCDKCELESSNEYYFNGKSYSYIDAQNSSVNLHLCVKCQRDLLIETNRTIAKFLGTELVVSWRERSSVS